MLVSKGRDIHGARGNYTGKVTSTDTDKGKHFTIVSERAAADPHATQATTQYSLHSRVDWVMGVHLPEKNAVDLTLRAC